MSIPECYGEFRSPRSNAENCCDECPHDAECRLQFHADVPQLRAEVRRLRSVTDKMKPKTKWTERIVDTTWGEVTAMCIVIFVLQLLVNWLGIGLDSTDVDGFHRSGVSVVTDHATGQEYLVSPHGGITPRLK